MNCTRCEATGFLNTDQLPDEVNPNNPDEIWLWLASKRLLEHDVQVCDCCGDGEHHYGEPGKHYGEEDPRGMNGPYSYNGGVAECH